LAGLTPERAARFDVRYMTADVLLAMGRFDSAYARFSEIARDTTQINALARVGTSAAGMHDTVTAKRIASELAAVQTRYNRARPTYWRAAIAAQLGDKAGAVELLRQAIREGQGVGSEMHRLTEFQSLRGYPPFEEILRPKG
jgi:hypothetical protein